MPTCVAPSVPMPSSSTKINGSVAAAAPKVVIEDARQDDIPIAAAIATAVFAEQSRPLYTAGPSAAQVAYRSVMFDDYFAGHLAFRQGKRRRPQRFVVARDAQTGRLVGFVYWTVHQPFTLPVDPYKDTDECLPDHYSPLPKAPKPADYNEAAFASFRQSSTQCQQDYVGHRPHCYVRYLCVDPSAQRCGAGRALMQAVRRENADMPIYLECATTESAKTFYLKMGFDQLGEMHFAGCVAPLPCMSLDPNTASLLDSVVHAAPKPLP